MPQSPVIQFTLFTAPSKGLLTKALSIGDQGEIIKTAPVAGSGTANTIELPFTELSPFISKLKKNQCLIHGVCGKSEIGISPTNHPRKGTIHRTKNSFSYPEGLGLGMIDFDFDGVGQYFTPKELVKVISSFFPSFKHAAQLIRYSTSSYVFTPGGTPLSSQEPGYHCYFTALNATDLPRFGKVLFKRLWLAGYGHCRLSKAGSILIRTCIDDKVYSPERCDFVAGAVLNDGLIQNFPVDEYSPGGYLDTRVLPNLTSDEEDKYQRLVLAERTRLKPEQPKARRQYAETQNRETGESIANILSRLDNAEKGVISETTALRRKSSGTPMTIADMIKGGMHGEYIEDPTEHSNTYARLYINGPGDAIVRSFLHGGTSLRVVANDNTKTENDEFPLVLPKLNSTDHLIVENSFENSLEMLGQQKAISDIAKHTLAIVHKFSGNVPIRYSKKELINQIKKHCPQITDVYALLLSNRLEWIVSKNKSHAVNLTKMTSNVTKRHKFKIIAPNELSVIRNFRGVIAVKAPMASGKTQKVGKPLRDAARALGKRFLAICHRISLTAELASRLDCFDYNDIFSDLYIEASDLAICVNSLPKFSEHAMRADFVLIDEFSQVLRHIALAPVEARTAVLELFKTVISNAKVLIITDADLTDRDILFLEQCRPSEKFQIYEAVANHCNLSVTFQYGRNAVNDAYGDILARLANGEKIIVATDSRKKVSLLCELVRREQPDKRIIGIDQTTRGGKKQQAFIDDPNGECSKYDLVVHSPTISSGVSIENDHFGHGFGLFFGVVVPSDAIQSIRRARNLTNWHLAFDINNTDAGISDEDLRIKSRLSAYQSSHSTINTLTELEYLIESVEAWEAAGCSNFARTLIFQLGGLGYKTKLVVLGPHDKEDKITDAKNDQKHQEIEQILLADDISSETAKLLLRTLNISHTQYIQLQRHRLQKDLCIKSPTISDIEFWDNGYGMMVLRRFEIVTGYVVNLGDTADPATQTRFNKLRKNMYCDVLDALGVNLHANDNVFTIEQAQDGLDLILVKSTLFAYLGIAPTNIIHKIPTDPIKFINKVLKRLGLTVKGQRKRSEGMRPRNYRITPQSLSRLHNYARHRHSDSPENGTLPDDYVYKDQGKCPTSEQIRGNGAETKSSTNCISKYDINVGTKACLQNSAANSNHQTIGSKNLPLPTMTNKADKTHVRIVVGSHNSMSFPGIMIGGQGIIRTRRHTSANVIAA